MRRQRALMVYSTTEESARAREAIERFNSAKERRELMQDRAVTAVLLLIGACVTVWLWTGVAR